MTTILTVITKHNKDAQVEIHVTHKKQMQVIALVWVNYIIFCVVYKVLALIKNMLRFSSLGLVWVMPR